MSGNTYAAVGMDIRQSIAAFWRALQSADGHLPDVGQDGCGEVVGGHLRVRFAHDSEQGGLLACEVLNMRTAEIWEAGFARTAGCENSSFTYWRRTSGTEEEAPPAWSTAVQGLHLADWHPRLQPTFLALVCAYSAAGGFALTENIANRASLDDELAYWRELARSQARVIDQIRGAQPDRSAPQLNAQAEVSRISEDALATREWRLRDIGEWAALNSERIVILPRALAAARKSEFSEPSIVFAALEVLASTYPAVKKGAADRHKVKDELSRLNMEIGGSVDPSVAGLAGSEYFVNWQGRRRFLDQHIKKGTSRDPRYSMRIYYTWDEELELVVVGWLPGHLSNSRT